jgi:hypothetical protein
LRQLPEMPVGPFFIKVAAILNRFDDHRPTKVVAQATA